MKPRLTTCLICCVFTLSLVGCVSRTAGPGEWQAVVDTEWTLEKIDGRRPLTAKGQPGEPITLDLSGDGRAVGFTGVNRFFGQYEATPTGDLRFGALGATRIYRDDPPGLMEQESRLLELLSTVDAYRVRDQRLFLSGQGQRLLTYRAIPRPLGTASASNRSAPITPE